MRSDVSDLNVIRSTPHLPKNKIKIEEGFELMVYENKNTIPESFSFQNNTKNSIHLHFCDAGSCKVSANNRSNVELLKGTFLICNMGLLDVAIHKNTRIIILSINHHKLHRIFAEGKALTRGFANQPIEKDVFFSGKTSPVNCVILSQIVQSLTQNKNGIYIRAKAYELLCVFIHQFMSKENNVCTYFKCRENLEKLKNAKEILENNISEPPSLVELSKIVLLPFSKLQKGFKEVYGYTLYDYLRHYKMMQAMQLLKRNNLTIQEVALEIGYSTSSHFITAFRKKFGITPKKYIMNLK
ncbi:helix-turn-helix transcriptional regulator [Aquimarina litoralis]|uniref:helix-turn-helix transcriptional regulator n=1 Tax=Aquimarina litoralis TaxID=584605 RepID=UPI001C58235F|nr:AraC family transcriptional regulator [Aquimarina litoralis]MBW1294432.1 helix-turn-helix domain-containing protein [Aquimarina litoralis]